MIRTLVVGTAVALAAAVSTSDPSDRPEPAWLEEICSQVTTC